VKFEFDEFVGESFENQFHEKILNIFEKEKSISLKFVDSSLSPGVQFVDLIAWCIFQKIENNDILFLKNITKKVNIHFYDKNY
jgi:hypothetical protein